ncbi:MAG: MDR family MFS transporter [Myxococcota bacterium]
MSTAAAPPVLELTRQEKVLTLAGMLLAMFLAALDQTVVATAGPDIQRSLGIEPSLYTWITTAYLVASTVLVPVYGKLSDTYGRRRIVVIGVLIFLAGSVACGLSRTTAQLILFRALQGVGSASIFTSAFAVVADLFSPRERGRYSGIFGAVFGVSSLVGPLLGGLITDTVGWHWVFFINVPLGAVALTFIALRMPALKPRERRGAVDVPGALLLGLGAVPLLVALSMGRPTVRPGETGFEWLSAPELLLFGVALVGVVAFVAWERRAKEPLMDFRLFESPMVTWGSLAVFVLGGAFLTPMVFLPLFMVNVVGVSATASGLTISPLVLGVVAGNVLSGQLVSRFGRYKGLMLGTLVLLSAAFSVMALTLTPASTQGEVTAKMVLLGLGLGPTIPLYTIAIQNAVPLQQLGVATSMVTFFRQMGSTVSLALVGSLFGTTLSHELDARMAEATKGLPPAMVERFRGGPQGAVAEGGPAHGHFDAGAVKARLGAQLDGARAVAKRALAGDAIAAALVAQSPLADERLKAAVAAGGVKAQVAQVFEALRVRVAQAAQSPEAWTALQAAGDLPPEVQAAVAQVPGAAMGQAESRAEALRRLNAGLDAAEAAAAERALAQAVAQVDQAVDAGKAQASAAVDAVGAAVKAAFTEAIRLVFFVALALAALSFLLTLKLPQLPLRGAAGPPVPLAE